MTTILKLGEFFKMLDYRIDLIVEGLGENWLGLIGIDPWDWDWSLGQEDPLEEEIHVHLMYSFILCWFYHHKYV